MGNATTASVTGVQVAPAKSAIRDLPIAKVWAFAVGQFGWALLSGIISNWLVYFYQPDQETISQGQTSAPDLGHYLSGRRRDAIGPRRTHPRQTHLYDHGRGRCYRVRRHAPRPT